MPRIIIDTDPGVDDAIAILMALAAPSVELAGLTVVGGNVPHARCLRNALALVEYAGREDVPVFRGSSRPLSGKFPYSRRVHGRSGLSRPLPEPAVRPRPGGAVDYLASELSSRPGEITLVALGPLTNLARLERQSPGVLSQAAALVVMGGAVDCPGNFTPHAEFNFYSDPRAAREVLSCDVPLTLVDLGATRQTDIDRGTALGLRSDHRLGRLAAHLVQDWFEVDGRRERFHFHDPLALAATLQPGVITTYQGTLAIETEGAEAGASRIVSHEGHVSVADRVDVERLKALMGEWLEWEGV